MRTFTLSSVAAIATAMAIALPSLAGTTRTSALPTANLLQNAGAEAGSGATTYEPVPVPGWTTTGGFTAITYKTKALDMVSLEEAAGFGGGVNQFVGGGGKDAVATALQTVDVSADGAIIDAGTVVAKLSALIGGSRAQEDSGKVEAAFLDAGGAVVGGIAIGPVTAEERQRVSKLLPKEGTAAVPPGTRSIRITITATRVHGSYNEASFDNLSLTLAEAAAPHAALKVAPKCKTGRIVVSARPTANLRIASVSFTTKGSPASLDESGPFTADLAIVPAAKRQVVTATVTDVAGRSWKLTARVRPCPSTA
jgi:hypothetical protein